jgi:hypothetical protein
MAEALKTFREGEDILASDTNENNQFLLSRLSDNAAQVQQYVEGEVATIKSNVSSVQATLQNNLDELATSLNNYMSISIEDGQGFVKFANGLKVYWGKLASVSGEGSTTIKFAEPFENIDYVVAGSDSVYQTAGDKSCKWYATGFTTSSFTLGWEFVGRSGQVCWFAIGK